MGRTNSCLIGPQVKWSLQVSDRDINTSKRLESKSGADRLCQPESDFGESNARQSIDSILQTVWFGKRFSGNKQSSSGCTIKLDV